MTKTALRTQYRALRKALSRPEIEKASATICAGITRQSCWHEARTILIYIPMGSEVDTTALLREALESRVRLAVPLTYENSSKIGVSLLNDLGDLAPGPRGVYQPSPRFQVPVSWEKIDLAIVPGLAFDLDGGRLGSGGGYFDRLLALTPQAAAIGAAYDFQVRAKPLPMEPTDIRMKFLMTERRGWIQCG